MLLARGVLRTVLAFRERNAARYNSVAKITLDGLAKSVSIEQAMEWQWRANDPARFSIVDIEFKS